MWDGYLQKSMIKPLKPVGFTGVCIAYSQKHSVSDFLLAQDVIPKEELKDLLRRSVFSILRTDDSILRGNYHILVEDITKNPSLYKSRDGKSPKIMNIAIKPTILRDIAAKYNIDDYRLLVFGFDPYQSVRDSTELSSETLMSLLIGERPANLPERCVTKSLVEFAHKSFGTQNLYFSPKDDITDLMYSACSKLLAHIPPEVVESQLSSVIVSTISSCDTYAGVEGILLNKLGLPPVPTIELHDACAGFINLCRLLILFSPNLDDRGILAVTGDLMASKAGGDAKNRLLMSNGATALWASRCQDGYGLLGSIHLNIPELQYILTEDRDSGDLNMYGSKVKSAIERFFPILVDLIQHEFRFNLSKYKIISHQMNGIILDKLPGLLGIQNEQVVNVVKMYGNTSSSTIPTALFQCLQDGVLSEGDQLIFIGIGAGFKLGATAYVVDKELIQFGKHLGKHPVYI